MRTIAVSAIVCLLCAPAALAQVNNSIVQADIPFEFFVADKAYPPGTYSFQQSRAGLGLVQRPTDAGSYTGFLTTVPMAAPRSGAESSRVFFVKYDSDHVFLRSIWDADRASGWEMPRSRMERDEAAHKMVKVAAHEPQTLIILARVR